MNKDKTTISIADFIEDREQLELNRMLNKETAWRDYTPEDEDVNKPIPMIIFMLSYCEDTANYLLDNYTLHEIMPKLEKESDNFLLEPDDKGYEVQEKLGIDERLVERLLYNNVYLELTLREEEEAARTWGKDPATSKAKEKIMQMIKDENVEKLTQVFDRMNLLDENNQVKLPPIYQEPKAQSAKIFKELAREPNLIVNSPRDLIDEETKIKVSIYHTANDIVGVIKGGEVKKVPITDKEETIEEVRKAQKSLNRKKKSRSR